jgi:hypothetical protein
VLDHSSATLSQRAAVDLLVTYSARFRQVAGDLGFIHGTSPDRGTWTKQKFAHEKCQPRIAAYQKAVAVNLKKMA